MDELVGTLILGVVAGAGYALLALGLVLVYKGSRVFNFALGEFGTVAAFVTYILRVSPFQQSWPVAIAGGLAAGLLFGLLLERLVVQPLFNAPKVTLLVATAAISLGVISVQLLVGDAQTRFFPPIVAGNAFTVAGTTIGWSQILVLLVLAVVVVLLSAFFKLTDLGLAVLAASQEPTATNLVGISVRRISALVWGMSAVLGGLGGILLAQNRSDFTPGFVTGQVLIFAFVAAVIGGFTSLPGAVLGGMVLGLVQQLAITYADAAVIQRNLPQGREQVVIFALLLVVLLVRPTGLLGKEA
jgi:branched-chain amino acid transport system permease protein